MFLDHRPRRSARLAHHFPNKLKPPYTLLNHDIDAAVNDRFSLAELLASAGYAPEMGFGQGVDKRLLISQAALFGEKSLWDADVEEKLASVPRLRRELSHHGYAISDFVRNFCHRQPTSPR